MAENTINTTGQKISFVDVDEGVERDMQSVSRHYGLEEFINLSGYIESAAYDIRRLGFTFVGGFRDKTVIISASDTDDPLITLTSAEELEIEDILPIGEDKWSANFDLAEVRYEL